MNFVLIIIAGALVLILCAVLVYLWNMSKAYLDKMNHLEAEVVQLRATLEAHQSATPHVSEEAVSQLARQAADLAKLSDHVERDKVLLGERDARTADTEKHLKDLEVSHTVLNRQFADYQRLLAALEVFEPAAPRQMDHK